MRVLLAFFFLISSISFAQKETIVFVHGATGGGWDWKPMAQLLEAKGHEVYRPTLTGLGEKAHLADPKIDLNVHITDVVNMILFENLSEVVLVGHSYGGMVITGVADQIKDKIKLLIYIDAHIPENGMSAIDTRVGNGKGLLEYEKDGFFVPNWLDESKTPSGRKQSMATLTQKIRLENPPAGNGLKGVYILTVDDVKKPKDDPFFKYKAISEVKGWKVLVFESDHNPQNSHRKELCDLLLEVIK